MKEYLVLARLTVPGDAFNQLNVSSALESRREKVIEKDVEEVLIQVNRRINGDDEDDVREKVNSGKLLQDVPHEVDEIRKINKSVEL